MRWPTSSTATARATSPRRCRHAVCRCAPMPTHAAAAMPQIASRLFRPQGRMIRTAIRPSRVAAPASTPAADAAASCRSLSDQPAASRYGVSRRRRVTRRQPRPSDAAPRIVCDCRRSRRQRRRCDRDRYGTAGSDRYGRRIDPTATAVQLPAVPGSIDATTPASCIARRAPSPHGRQLPLPRPCRSTSPAGQYRPGGTSSYVRRQPTSADRSGDAARVAGNRLPPQPATPTPHPLARAALDAANATPRRTGRRSVLVGWARSVYRMRSRARG